MPTAEQVIKIAKKYIGVKENPANSNNVEFNTWYYGKPVVGSAYPWCLSYVMFIFNRANVKLPIKTASCGELMRAAKSAGMWVTSRFKPGDIAIFDFSGKQKTTQHCGIVEEVIPDYGVQSIEGNTGSTNDSNGGEVMRRRRASKFIIGAVRPIYEAEKAKEDVFTMTIQEFIDKLTNEQAYELLKKAQTHASTLAEPTWSKNEGHWQTAIDKGIVNGGSPEGLIKRDELIAVLGRKGLI